MAAHDDLQQAFPRSPGKLFHPHVVDDQQIGLEVTVERFILSAQLFIPQKVPGQIEALLDSGWILLFDELP